MTITRERRCRFASVLLLLSFALVQESRAQGSPISVATASNNFASATSEQASPPQAEADLPPQSGPKQLTNYVEAGGDYLTLTNGFGYWSGGYARGVVTSGHNVWNAEVNGQHEFGDSGVYLGAGDIYNFNPDWYGSLTIGSSVGGFFWPRFRGDGFINKKWMAHKQLITTFGFGYYAAKDVHRDHSFFVGTTYYFTTPWILEEGIRFNVSNPGSVFSPAGFVALTHGRNLRQYLTLRAGFGVEAYQLVGPTVALTDFESQTLTVTWRRWVGESWGVNLVGDSYHSPFYTRGGASFGFFREF
ncbi:MAG TPA: YaiO family outer membrane beta-barrel protein [Terriglobales bacterium]|jgi:YaiO family outer membrane protein|nr:YaiO family outer membrane beta-barrel protein [Terriglobales bacterium]